VPVDTRTPTTSTANVTTHALRHNDVLFPGHSRHRPPPPPVRRHRSPPLSPLHDRRVPVQPAAAAAAPVLDVSSVAERSSLADYQRHDQQQQRKVITIVDGTGAPRPRPNVKFLLNRQSVQTYEEVRSFRMRESELFPLQLGDRGTRVPLSQCSIIWHQW